MVYVAVQYPAISSETSESEVDALKAFDGVITELSVGLFNSHQYYIERKAQSFDV